jgi:thiol-disulfide isomerase/thioredoxin
MRKKNFLFCILCLTGFIFNAIPGLAKEIERTTVKGSFTVGNYKTVKIWSTLGKVMELVDSAKVINNQFEFKPRYFKQGMYLIGVAENNHVPIILDRERWVEIQFANIKLENNVKYIQSAQNIAWVQYLPRELKLNNAIRGAHKKEGNDSTIIKLKESELGSLRDSLANAHPNTFLYKMLKWKSDILPLRKATFWNHFDFSDTAITRCTILNDRIQRYMRKFSKGENSGYIQCAEEVLGKAKINEVVYEFTVFQMLNGFFESGMDNMCAYLIDQHLNSESCGEDDIHKLLTKTANSIQQLTVGHQPPNFNALTQQNTAFDMRKFAADHRYTILMFWSSWCEHCKAAAPEIVAFHNKYDAQKISMVGYSLDNVKDNWEKAITERGFQFINIFGGKQWESPVSKLYKVNKTPMFFVIDKQGTLQLKAKSIQEVESFIKSKI